MQLTKAKQSDNNKKSDKIFCIIVAAGCGSRFDQDTPKQYTKIDNEYILTKTIKAFKNDPLIAGILVVINNEHKNLYTNATKGMEVLSPVQGGKTRGESVRSGLKAIEKFNPDKVLIHDAARPFVSKEIITNICKALETNKAVVPIVRIKDTLKEISGNKIVKTIDRNVTVKAQTPQAFEYRYIKNLHDKFKDKDFTDDSALAESNGDKVVYVEGDEMNIKITHKTDLPKENTVKVGMGFDVHKFSSKQDVEKKDLIICGVKVPYDRYLIGHSDADVGIHSLVDAILGALGEGDIGEHFPPSNNKYKDMDSKIFLEFTRDLLIKKNAAINNIDITIICQEPKISPYKKDMQETLAKILDISSTLINIKATTTEGLGFTGRGEGVAVKSVAVVHY